MHYLALRLFDFIGQLQLFCSQLFIVINVGFPRNLLIALGTLPLRYNGFKLLLKLDNPAVQPFDALNHVGVIRLSECVVPGVMQWYKRVFKLSLAHILYAYSYGRKHYILLNGHIVKQIELLKDHTHLLSVSVDIYL